MDESLKARITAAVTAAIDALDEAERQTAADDPEPTPPPEPHRFGDFRLPDGAHIKGFDKWNPVE